MASSKRWRNGISDSSCQLSWGQGECIMINNENRVSG